MSKIKYSLAGVFAAQEWKKLRDESIVTDLSDGWVLLSQPNDVWPLDAAFRSYMNLDCEGIIIIAHRHVSPGDRTNAMRIPDWDGYCQCECVIPSEVLVMAQLEAFTTGYLIWTKPTHEETPF